MAKKKIAKLIEESAKRGGTELDLSNQELTTLPPEISSLTDLTHLNLSNNQLTSLPADIARLTNLTSLYLHRNRLESLPPEITQLSKLNLLNLADNPQTNALSKVAELTNLTTLNLNGQAVTSLLPEIAKLVKLTKLYLSACQLVDVPPEITRLTNLIHLDLSSNRLTSLPPEIAQLTKLAWLNLSHNELTGVPPEVAKLRSLESLGLHANQLVTLPLEITKLPKLSLLTLSGNPLPLPPETLNNTRDIKAIFAAIAGLEDGERLNEAKMLVVGDGKVGKSSVVQQLIYGTFNPQKQTTLGVEIIDEMKVVQSAVQGEGEPIKLNIWDFGGQEIQHSTHQFFLTTRSLYLLVVDARKGNQLENIEYWLKLIESFGGNSPIIIVINQIDQLKGQRPLNLDRRALQTKYNVRDFVETSCESGDGIAELTAAIAREVEQLKHVRDVWPREWIGIKQRLKATQADYIPVERYYEICGEEKLNDPDLRESLLDILHVLGTVVRFPGDTQVLNPRWVTRGVYGLLTSAQLVKNQGQFYLKDVGQILAGLPNADHYPPYTHERLIKVMQHFELCFEFTGRPGHYLIPRHLHDNELDIPWEDADALKFQYHYETLPDSVISRFIVRMNPYITKQYYWKNGVFLHSGENRAKIKADLVDRKIFISIIGKEQTRRAFLAVIRSAFDEINSNFKIEIKQMIPLPDEPNVFVSYDALLVHESKNKPTIFVYEVEKDYDVPTLLDGVEDMHQRMQRRNRDLVQEQFSDSRTREVWPKLQKPTASPKNQPIGSVMSYAFVFVILLAAIVGAAVAISKWVSATAGIMTGVIIIGALLALGVLGAMQLRNDDRLSEESFLKLMIESYKRLPLLKGGNHSSPIDE